MDMDDTVIRVPAPVNAIFAEVTHEYVHAAHACDACASDGELPKSRTTCTAAGIRRGIPAQTVTCEKHRGTRERLCDVTLAGGVAVA